MMAIRFITSHTFFRYVQMRSPSASSIYSQMALPVSLVQLGYPPSYAKDKLRSFLRASHVRQPRRRPNRVNSRFSFDCSLLVWCSELHPIGV